VFGPGRNPIKLQLCPRRHRRRPRRANHQRRGQIIEVAGPEKLTFVALADQLIAARQARSVRHVSPPVVHAVSVVAQPFSPVLARQAEAAVVMNTTAMARNISAIRESVPALPTTALDNVIG
jgi:hypothetical protein